MNGLDQSKFEELMANKEKLFQDILNYARQLSVLTYSEKEVEYKNLLQKRLNCMERISKIDVLMKNYLAGSMESNPVFQSNFTAYQENIKGLIRLILEIDERNRQQLILEQKKVKDRLRVVREGRRNKSKYFGMKKPSIMGAYMDTHR